MARGFALPLPAGRSATMAVAPHPASVGRAHACRTRPRPLIRKIAAGAAVAGVAALMTVGIAVARGILLPMPGRVSATAFPLIIRAVLPLMHAPAFPDVGPAMSLAVPLMSRQFIRSLSTAIPIQLGFHVFFHEIAPFWNIFHIIVQEKPGWAYCLPAGAHSLSTSPGKAPAAWPLPKNRRGSDVRRHSAKAPSRWPP